MQYKKNKDDKPKLTEFIDIGFLQEFQDFFAKTLDVASITVDDNGPITEPSNFTDFCIKYTRGTELGYSRCNACDIRWGKLASEKKEPVIYKCHTGLTDFAVPIVVDGVHIASILGGQVLTEPPNEEHFRDIARQLGINEEEYIEAVRNIKVVPEEKVKTAAAFMYSIANSISELGRRNLEIFKKNEREVLYRKITEAVRSSLDIGETKKIIVNVIGESLGADRCFIMDFDNANEKFLLVQNEYLSSSDIDSYIKTDVNIDVPEFCGMLKAGKTVLINNKEIWRTHKGHDFKSEQYAIDRNDVKSALAVPLYYGSLFLGAIALHYVKVAHLITEPDIDLLNVFASQVSVAIYQSRQFEQAQRQNQRERLLREITEKTRSSLGLDEVLTFICEETAKLFNVQRSAITVFPNPANFEEYIIKKEYKVTPEIKGYQQSDSFYKAAAYWGENLLAVDMVLAFDNVSESNTPEYFRYIYESLGIKAMLGTSIRKGNNVYGTLVLSEYENYRHWTEEEKTLIDAISSQVYIAINQAELFEETKIQAEREKLIGSIVSRSIRTFDLRDFKTMVYDIGVLSKADRCYFVEVDLENMNGKPVDPNSEYLSSPDIKSIIGYDFPREDVEKFVEAYKNNRDLVFFDYEDIFNQESGQYIGMKKYARLFDLKTGIGIPFFYENKLSGLLCIEYVKSRKVPSSDEFDFLRILGNQSGMAFNQILLYQKAKKTAQTEKLVRELIESVRSSFDLTVVKSKVLENLCKIFNADRCYFRAYDREKEKFLPVDVEYLSSSDVPSLINIEPNQEGLKYFIDEVNRQNKGFYPIVADEHFAKGTPLAEYMETSGIIADYAMPMINLQDELLWLVLHYSKEDPKFNEDTKRMLEAIAYQVDIALSQIKLFDAVKLSAQREHALRKITEQIRSSLDIEQTLSFICEETAKMFHVDRVTVVQILSIEDTQKFSIRKEFKKRENIISPQSSQGYEAAGAFLINNALSSNKPFFFNNIEQSDAPDFIKEFCAIDSYWKERVCVNAQAIPIVNIALSDLPQDAKNAYAEMGVKSIIAIPIILDGVTWGGLILSEYDYYREWKKEEIELLETITSQIQIAIRQSMLYENEKETSHREMLLRSIFETMRSSLDINVIKTKIVNEVGRALSADLCIIAIYDVQESHFYIDEHSEYLSSLAEYSFIGFDTKHPKVKFFNDEFIKNKEVIYSNADKFIQENKLENTPEAEFLNEYHIKSSYCIPINYAGSLRGLLILHYTREYTQLNESDLIFLRTIATQAGIALHQASLFEITKLQAERERLSKNMIEILRSTLDKNIIKHLFVKNIGELFKADRVFLADYDPKINMYLPIDKNSEYLSSPAEKSFVGYDWSSKEANEYIQPLLNKRELKIPSWVEFIVENSKSQEFIALFEESDVKSSYNFPVVYEDKMMGYFCIEFTKEVHKLSNEDINRIRNICTQTGIALYHSDLLVKAQEATRSKAEFISNITHEFKVPLNFIIEFSELLSKTELERSKQLMYLSSINSNSRQLLELTDDIIDISQIESNVFKLHYEHIDSAQLIKGVLSSFELRAFNKNIIIESKLVNANVSADKTELTKIIHILMTNAIKFTQRGGKIIITSALDGDELFISIEDTGFGTDADEQDKIFDELKQVDTIYTRRQQGSGLGLSIAKKLVELHNGTIHVESAGQKGSRFWLTLPKASIID